MACDVLGGFLCPNAVPALLTLTTPITLDYLSVGLLWSTEEGGAALLLFTSCPKPLAHSSPPHVGPHE